MPVVAGDGIGCVGTTPAASAFEGPVFDCFVSTDMRVLLEAPTSRFDAFAAATMVAPDGSTRPFVAAREPGGKLYLRLGPGQARAIEGAGAQVAVGDLDQDGVPEVVTSGDAGEDAITVLSWNGTSDPKQRLRFPAPAG